MDQRPAPAIARENEKTPEDFQGWDGDMSFGCGGTPGDAYYLTVWSTYDGPAHISAWCCKTCHAIVPHDSIEAHRQWHNLTQ